MPETPYNLMREVGRAIFENDTALYVAKMDAYVQSFDNEELNEFWRERRVKYLPNA